MSASDVTYYPTGGGYNCAVCGAWVPAGITHSCGGQYRQPEVRWDRMSDVRIADALEKIAGCLADVADALHTTVNLYAHLDVEDARADLSLLELQV